MKPWALHIAATRRCLNNTRGLSLLVLVLVLTVAAAAAVGLIVFKVKLQDVQRESLTKVRLDAVREALQRYYLSHHDLPEPAATTPTNTVPVAALNLDQQYRLDAQGQFFHYDRLPATGITDILGVTASNVQVAAVLVAAGPDGVIAADNQSTPYDDPNDPDNDDIVVGVPLRAEATKIAQWSVEVLQRAAIAYTRLFEEINNDGTGTGVVGNPTTGDTYYPPPREVDPDGIPGNGDEYLDTPPPQARDGDEIDEDGCGPATGGVTFGCLHFGVLGNDPGNNNNPPCTNLPPPTDYWTPNCPTLAGDIVAAYGLNPKYASDPWGTPYKWNTADQVIYSWGEDRAGGTTDDIVATERLPQP